MNNKILIVDDSKFMRNYLKQILTNGGFQVIAEAADGDDAVCLFKSASPDIVMLDLNMSRMDGITTLKEIKNYDPNARIVICSAMGQSLLMVEALQLGAIDFIVKPFFDELIPILNRARK
ncbi:response regulator [Cytobacillus firmus]|uniref:response regulator n=1 Tax=Cytobacillus firmus TaxID=1399 RepID=UPI0018CCA6F7|nr:response regulator [Cytobacillus firmus]MBG9587266.1 chemotaxis protein CheY [Cytobacillus firmus]